MEMPSPAILLACAHFSAKQSAKWQLLQNCNLNLNLSRYVLSLPLVNWVFDLNLFCVSFVPTKRAFMLQQLNVVNTHTHIHTRVGRTIDFSLIRQSCNILLVIYIVKWNDVSLYADIALDSSMELEMTSHGLAQGRYYGRTVGCQPSFDLISTLILVYVCVFLGKVSSLLISSYPLLWCLNISECLKIFCLCDEVFTWIVVKAAK